MHSSSTRQGTNGLFWDGPTCSTLRHSGTQHRSLSLPTCGTKRGVGRLCGTGTGRHGTPPRRRHPKRAHRPHHGATGDGDAADVMSHPGPRGAHGHHGPGAPGVLPGPHVWLVSKSSTRRVVLLAGVLWTLTMHKPVSV
jgi:hypothetical protein